jgi:hypothetical protein
MLVLYVFLCVLVKGGGEGGACREEEEWSREEKRKMRRRRKRKKEKPTKKEREGGFLSSWEWNGPTVTLVTIDWLAFSIINPLVHEVVQKANLRSVKETTVLACIRSTHSTLSRK